MVIDDETDIVCIFRRSLEMTGYTVFAFTDPILALDHFKSNAGRYGVIITDVRMPNMTGVELAKEIRKIDPSIAIILMSAFDMKELEISPSLHIAGLLQKPVTADQLRDEVSRFIPVLPLE
jgi:CheY-like chemotaxis protein